MKSLVCALIILFLAVTAAEAYTGRRAVLYARGQLMLAENLPHKKQDCSSAAWTMLNDCFPELAVTKWFHRTTAEAMGSWPWKPVNSLGDLMFGDLLFANSNDNNPKKWSPKENFKIRHVMIGWVRPQAAVHASSKKGFTEDKLAPYWEPRIVLIIRPPY
jgi:hypothetical protein